MGDNRDLAVLLNPFCPVSAAKCDAAAPAGSGLRLIHGR